MRPSWARLERLPESSLAAKRRIGSGKQASTAGVGSPEAVNSKISSPTVPFDLSSLNGEANEYDAFVDGHQCIALLDTGSQVTSISKSFFKEHLSDWTIQSAKSLLIKGYWSCRSTGTLPRIHRGRTESLG